jgi:predicted RNA-binding Zn-ribbon protein involved in translation (DUF1610 family)
MILLTPASGPECPRCGCRDSRILQKPNPKRWYGRFGKARCGHCFLLFSIQDDDVGDVDQPSQEDDFEDGLDIAEPAQEQPDKTKLPPDCQSCGTEMKVSSTRKAFRWYKCPECGKTKKVPRAISTPER